MATPPSATLEREDSIGAYGPPKEAHSGRSAGSASFPSQGAPGGPTAQNLLAGVDLARWAPLIEDAKLNMALAGIAAAGDADRLAPPASLIFEALRYGGPEDYRVVLIAQDPYPGPGEAQGLCFSVPRGFAPPESLKRIFACLQRAGCRRQCSGEDCGDLRAWAAQGVLMLNSALTTRVGCSRAHASHWKPFVGELLRRFCALHEEAGRRLHFLLWGGDARTFAPLARRHRHHVHEWSHPSPMADNKLPEHARFRMCPHFEAVNEALVADGCPPIIWDNLAPVLAFSDGSCSSNGMAGARAGFAAILVGGPFRAAVVRGEIRPCSYGFVDEDRPERGVRPLGGVHVAPTNNRGELMGLVYCFLAALRGCAVGPVEVVSDSEIAVKTLNEWLPSRLAKGTERELKNFDLVWVAWRLLGALKAQAAAVALTHVRGHQKRPSTGASRREEVLWAGNEKADKHAALALERETSPQYALEVLDAPPVLANLTELEPSQGL